MNDTTSPLLDALRDPVQARVITPHLDGARRWDEARLRAAFAAAVWEAAGHTVAVAKVLLAAKHDYLDEEMSFAAMAVQVAVVPARGVG